jgi:hypothetical protein
MIAKEGALAIDEEHEANARRWRAAPTNADGLEKPKTPGGICPNS